MRVVALFVVVLPLAACVRREAAEPPPPETGLFEPIASVVMHPRCINCHQDESPRQTDEKIVHRPFVVRGKDDHGAPTQPCQTCHQATNTADGFVPRSEEHTSELQSQSNLVCRLLLEKKKK